MIWLLNQLELTAVAALIPQKLAYAINEGFPPTLWRAGGFLRRVSSHGQLRQRQKAEAGWNKVEGWREVKESTLFDLLERKSNLQSDKHTSSSPNQTQPHSLSPVSY